MKIGKKIGVLLLITIAFTSLSAQPNYQSIVSGVKWRDNNSTPINAHGGGLVFHDGKYYWFGEHKGVTGDAYVGVHCYSSTDLYNWTDEGIAMPVSDTAGSDIESGCKIERPKVIYNASTGKFVMYFHLELKGKGYDAARVGIAVADQATGPYQYLKSLRPNAGKWPIGCSSPADAKKLYFNQYLIRDFDGGQMSRDMTLFVDDDGQAYHIYSAEGNATLHIALLTEDYLSHSGTYTRVMPGYYNEAPAIFKRGDRYYMITSGTTGWAPNPARQLTAKNIMGPWREFPNPCVGNNADKTFLSQSTFALPVEGKKGAYIYMGDRWESSNLQNSVYVWLPISYDNGLLKLEWVGNWKLDRFNTSYDQLQKEIDAAVDFRSKAVIGDQVGEFSSASATLFDQAIARAKTVTSDASVDQIDEAIIRLSNAAADFQEGRKFRQLNTLQEGNYYIKVNNQYYLTNSPEIASDKPLILSPEKIENSDKQIFHISKHPLTDRYKIVSKLDNRNVNEKCCIRKDWGTEDPYWRTMNIHFNGSRYAIQTDGKSFGMVWRFDTSQSAIHVTSPFRILVDSEVDFLFSLEEASGGASLGHIEGEPEVCLFSDKNRIRVETHTPVHLYTYNTAGVLIHHLFTDSSTEFSLPCGLYIVRADGSSRSSVSKIVVP